MATFSSQAVKACRLRPKSLSTHILTLFAETMNVHRKFPVNAGPCAGSAL